MIKLFKQSKLLNKWNSSVYFEEIICMLLMFISLFVWKFQSFIGMMLLVIIAAILLFVFNDFKYMIPSSIYFLYSFSEGFNSTNIPIHIFVAGGLLVFVLFVYMIINGFHIKKARSCIGLIGLAVLCFIPIFWSSIDYTGKEYIKILFLAYLLYLVIYILFVSNLKDNSFRILSISMSYLCVYMALQLGLKIFELHQASPGESIFTFWYYLGWGLCNEAGILMLFGIPFIFILIIKSNNLYQIIMNLIKLFITMLGMIITNSRGTMLCGFLLIFVLVIISICYSKQKLKLFLCYFISLSLGLIIIQLAYGIPNLISNIFEKVFEIEGDSSFIEKIFTAIDLNGRREIWQKAINAWNRSPITRWFGNGLVSEYDFRPSFNGDDLVVLVYHSTMFETLACFGIVGVVFLIIHLIEKYFSLLKIDKSIMLILTIGYGVVDIYGMLDNTYSMWYYMIPLVIVMASVDVTKSNSELLFY